MSVEIDAYLTDAEIMSWSEVQPSSMQDLIDPRLIEWLLKRGFDLNQPIKTRRISEAGVTQYSQPRLSNRIVVTSGFLPKQGYKRN